MSTDAGQLATPGIGHLLPKVWVAIGLMMLSNLIVGTANGDSPPDPMILGVHPYLSHSALHHRFKPLARYLAHRLGMPVAVRIGNTYRDHIDAIGRDRIDLAFVGPVPYLQIADNYGPKPLLARLETNGNTELGGHIVVREDSPLRRLEDLTGRRMGFGDPYSTMSNVVPHAVLNHAGIEVRRPTPYRSHSNVALAVLSGQVDAGAVKEEVFEQFAAQGLRSLRRLPAVSEHVFIARADMPQSMLRHLRAVLHELHTSAAGRRALSAIHRNATALRPVADADLMPLRALLSPPVEDVAR